MQKKAMAEQAAMERERLAVAQKQQAAIEGYYNRQATLDEDKFSAQQAQDAQQSKLSADAADSQVAAISGQAHRLGKEMPELGQAQPGPPARRRSASVPRA
jgi:hypothetical protein